MADPTLAGRRTRESGRVEAISRPVLSPCPVKPGFRCRGFLWGARVRGRRWVGATGVPAELITSEALAARCGTNGHQPANRPQESRGTTLPNFAGPGAEPPRTPAVGSLDETPGERIQVERNPGHPTAQNLRTPGGHPLEQAPLATIGTEQWGEFWTGPRLPIPAAHSGRFFKNPNPHVREESAGSVTRVPLMQPVLLGDFRAFSQPWSSFREQNLTVQGNRCQTVREFLKRVSEVLSVAFRSWSRIPNQWSLLPVIWRGAPETRLPSPIWVCSIHSWPNRSHSERATDDL